MGIGFVARPVITGCDRVFRGLARFGLCASLAISPGAALAATVPGAIPGSHQISPGGAFVYTVPIAVPPGVAGIEPKLSLVYNSQGGNGLAGVGWSLAGLSAIARCGQTIVQDGTNRGVQFDTSDRFCLDGQRLVAINGTYGAVGTEYRTESESYTRVVSIGGAAGNPQYFKAWTKDGHILVYGNTTDSRLETQAGTAVITWAVNKLRDTLGNYMTFTYIEDNVNGDSRLTRVDYSGNATANTNPNNSVRFTYESRLDAEGTYIGAQFFKMPQRLAKIEAFAGNSLLRDYRLTYASQASANDTSRIVEIESCAGSGDCLRKTTLQWDVASQTNMAQAPWPYSNMGYSTPVAIADLNGDGRGDLITGANNSGTYRVHYSNGAGFSGSISLTAGIDWSCSDGLCVPPPPVAGDLNGDGRADLIIKTNWDSINKNVLLSNVVQPDSVRSIETGLSATTSVSYAPLTDASVYSKDSGAVYPYVDVQAPLYVVSSVATSDGLGGTVTADYTYAGARSHQLGGGFLGFRQVVAREAQSGLRNVTAYRQDYPYQGQPLSTQTLTGGGTLVSRTLITYTDQLLDTGKSPVWHRSLPTRTVETSYELTGGLISTVTTDTAYDAWANPTTIVVDSGGGYSKTTTNTYDNIVDPDRWFLGRLRRSTVTSVTP